MNTTSITGRRVATVSEITEPGDYCGPTRDGYRPDRLACYFLLPGSRDDDASPGHRSIQHVAFPPHTYRECDDGSLEIRASIGADPYWHGFLDEGHLWRSC